MKLNNTIHDALTGFDTDEGWSTTARDVVLRDYDSPMTGRHSEARHLRRQMIDACCTGQTTYASEYKEMREGCFVGWKVNTDFEGKPIMRDLEPFVGRFVGDSRSAEGQRVQRAFGSRGKYGFQWGHVRTGKAAFMEVVAIFPDTGLMIVKDYCNRTRYSVVQFHPQADGTFDFYYGAQYCFGRQRSLLNVLIARVKETGRLFEHDPMRDWMDDERRRKCEMDEGWY